MDGYILTADGHILSRIILIVFVMIHCIVAYKNAGWRFHVSPVAYHGFFLAEFVALTAFVVWGCINEPFRDGILLAVIGYVIVYLTLFSCWFALGRVMISHTKVYQMLPYLKVCIRGQKGIEGYIMEGGRSHAVLIFSDELYDSIKDASYINVKFKDYTYGEEAVMFEALMEIADQ